MAGDGETLVENTPQNIDVPNEKKEAIEDLDCKKEQKKDEEKKEKVEKKKEAPLCVHKKDFEPDVVYLYQFGRSPQIPSFCSFCLKLETWLKMSGIKFESVDHKNKLRSKRGKLPFVEINGEEICDSGIIIKTLGKKFGFDIDEGLGNEQKNVQHAMLAMVENRLNWTILHWKCSNSDNILKGYNLNLQTLMGLKFPVPVLNLMYKHTFLRKIMKNVKASCMGGYTNDEIEQIGKADLTVLSEMLGDKKYFFGLEPHSLDLIAFVQVAQLVLVDKEVSCPLRDFLESDAKNLIDHFNRMKENIWGEQWEMSIGEALELNPHIPKPDPPKPEEEKTAPADQEKVEEKGKEEKEKEENKD